MTRGSRTRSPDSGPGYCVSMGEALRGGAVPSVENLAEALAVSPSTIRRDLAFLRAQGHVIHTRGQRRAG